MNEQSRITTSAGSEWDVEMRQRDCNDNGQKLLKSAAANLVPAAAIAEQQQLVEK